MARFPLPWRRDDVAKASQQFPAQTPAPIEQAMAEQGMDSSVQMGPGRPINPAWGYSTRPRAMDYPVGVNIASGDNRQAWGRTSYGTLRDIIRAYDIARMCINHKIDELRSMEPLLQPIDGFSGDADAAIDAARAALEFPDRQLPYDAWLSKWMESVLKFDAGTLYRRRNYAGEVIGLETIDGTTMTPLLDGNGRLPAPPALAYEQVIKGLRTTGFTTDDIVQTVFRPQEDSPFGLAPIESVLLTVNTDIRHQWHFLQMFTEGSVPAGFMELPPDVSSPDQVDEWQQYYDSWMLGDQGKKHQVIAVPNGSKLTETRPKAFDRAFPEWLAVRTCAAFGVVPQDLGLTMDVNRANGETQVDVQFRVNTLPYVGFVERTLTRYLRKDLGLPVQVKLDTGRDKEDRKTEAEAWQIYVNSGAASVDEMREELLGLPTDNERPVPRFVNGARTGPVPLTSIFSIAGAIDPETKAPADSVPLDTTPFDGAGGVLADKSPGGSQFKRAPVDPDEPEFPQLEHAVPGSDVLGTTPGTKPVIDDPAEGQAVESVQTQADPVTATQNKVATEDTVKPVGKAAAADELAAFRRFVAKQAKTGRWRRDFTFTATDAATAHGLNQHARARVRKAAGELVAAGLAVVAADTGRVLMLQRALDPTDPNGGLWEFPGGCIEPGEDPNRAARREWSEETGLDTPYADGGDPTPDWTSANGVYAGYIQVVLAEADVPIFDRAEGMNPDDPDGDAVEALAWWEPEQLVGNPAIRPELAASLDAVLPLIEVVGAPKAPVGKSWRDGAPKTPAHHVDLRLVDYWAPRLADALAALVTPAQIRAAIDAARALVPVAKSVSDDGPPDEPDPRDEIAEEVKRQLGGQVDTAAIEQTVRQVIADGYLAGGMAARRQLGPNSVTLDGQTGSVIAGLDWDAWQPGDVDAAIADADGGLAQMLDSAGIGIKGIVGDALDGLGNRIADGLLDGASVDTIASSLGDWASGFRAERIAQTESARAVTAATLDTYRANGVGRWNLLLSAGACEECTDAASLGPFPADDDEYAPPIHPFCRCSASPDVDSIT